MQSVYYICLFISVYVLFSWLFYFWLFRHYGQYSFYVCVATAAGSRIAIIIIIVTIGWLADCIQLYVVDSVHFRIPCIYSVCWIIIIIIFILMYFFHCTLRRRPIHHSLLISLYLRGNQIKNVLWILLVFDSSAHTVCSRYLRKWNTSNLAITILKLSKYSYSGLHVFRGMLEHFFSHFCVVICVQNVENLNVPTNFRISRTNCLEYLCMTFLYLFLSSQPLTN